MPVLSVFGTGDKYLSVAGVRGGAKYIEDFTQVKKNFLPAKLLLELTSLVISTADLAELVRSEVMQQ